MRYAEGHRLAQRGEDGFCFGSCGKSSDGDSAARRMRAARARIEHSDAEMSWDFMVV